LSDSDKTKQIREMAKLSLLSNKISPIQEKNLKIFPFIFFDGVQSVKIDYDFSNNQTVETEEDIKNLEISYKINQLETKHFRVTYYLTIDQEPDSLLINNRFFALENSVRNLFWKETKVEVFINNELKYQSRD